MTSTRQSTRRHTGEGVSSAARVADLGSRERATRPLAEACDRLCRLAAKLLDVTTVLVTLKDEDRPFLAGSVGLEAADPDRWWGHTPLSIAVSDQASADGSPLVIEDLGDMELLSADPLHQEHGYRALLAVPLQPGPANFGSLCALSQSPHCWSDAEARVLGDIAESVVTEIQLRGSARQIRSVEEASVRSARRSFIGLIDSIEAVVKERDARDGHFTFVSKGAEALFGYPIERWMEEPRFWRDVLVHPDDRAFAERSLQEAAQGRGTTFEYRVCAADGRTLWIRDSLSLVQQGDEPPLLRGVIVDVTARKQAELALQEKNRALELLQDLTMRANEADAEAGLLHAVERMAAHVGWPVGHVWMRAPVSQKGPEELMPTGIWHLADPDRFEPFRRATETARFGYGHGLPGRVAESGEPAWIGAITEDPDFPRAEAASESGLRSGFAFPILSGREVLAVVELYTTEETAPDETLSELAGHVGAVLGRVLERRRAASERRAQEERIRRIIETAQDPFVTIDESGRIREWNPAAERLFGWSQEEALDRPLVETIIPERFHADHQRGFERFLRTGEGPLVNRRVEVPARRKDGEELTVELTISPVDIEGRWFFNAFLHDITERLRADEERTRHENLLAETQRLARIGSWEWDIATDAIVWSDELHRLFGTDPRSFDPTFEEYLGRLSEDDRDLAQRTIGAALAEPGPFEFNHAVVLPDGEERLIHSQGKVVVGDDGEPVRMVGTAQDITEQARARKREHQLAREQIARGEAEAAQAQIRRVVESITDAFVGVDRELRITFVNTAAARLLQGDPDSLPGRILPEVLPEGTEAITATCRAALGSEKPHDLEVSFGDVWFEVHVFPSGDGLSLYLHDATDRRRAEELVRASEARYRFLADAVPQQIWTADPDGSLDYVNQVAADYFGVDEEALLGDGWTEYVHPEDIGKAGEQWGVSLASGDPYETEFRLRRQDGSHRWHLARAKAQRGAGGETLRWYGTNTDIHDQKELEAARDQALDDLERVTHLLSSERTNLEMQTRELLRTTRALTKTNEDLDRFAYVASHDLKAPLRGIANLTEWLVDDLADKLTDETREYSNLLQNRVQRMEDLIDGVLQYSRAGRSSDEPETVDVGELVREVVDMLDPPSHFDIRLARYWPVIRTERVPLQQVFLNLVGNALKHADGEKPVIEVNLRDEGEDFCEFSISDNGPGIAPEYHQRIFTIFQTLKARDEVEGTGIGLSVVKRIVENNGGQVWVESEVGKGATFSFLWPRNPEAKERNLG